ncbi:hypothetical protein [Moorena producens]|uniref:hypothetical protein n=1 Tax=Moorena producens TaxID=1155739 RepID=UPI003C788158
MPTLKASTLKASTFNPLQPWPLATLREQPWPWPIGHATRMATLREQPSIFNQPTNLQPS